MAVIIAADLLRELANHFSTNICDRTDKHDKQADESERYHTKGRLKA
ncbi:MULTISPECIES: hypothetical protein [unclassified Paenibacillus]|nr:MULTISPECIES: hypothetical protein [unclassified Paenibacillus]MDQ0900245.1 hypothetical protein [Paenibacillus sp. V4I7]MDQ0921243.1 hypothetical protein [Paenibacillus sp. V4I5]